MEKEVFNPNISEIAPGLTLQLSFAEHVKLMFEGKEVELHLQRIRGKHVAIRFVCEKEIKILRVPYKKRSFYVSP